MTANRTFAGTGVLAIAGLLAIWMVLALVALGSCSAGVGPPESTLRFDGEAQRGGNGTFCWHEERRFWFDGGQCVDMVGVWIPTEPLMVRQGETMIFQFGGETAPSELRWGIVGTRIEQENPPGMQLFEHSLGGVRERSYTQDGTRAEFTADLLPGEYVVTVSIRAPAGEFVAPSGQRLQSTNSATYGFHIIVV